MVSPGKRRFIKALLTSSVVPRNVPDNTGWQQVGNTLPTCQATANSQENAGPLGALPVTDAVLGTTLEVPILEDGKAAVGIPAGIQPDTVLRLRNKGLPRFGGKGRGDMYLQVRIQIPEKLSREERELYERLRALPGKPKRHFWE